MTGEWEDEAGLRPRISVIMPVLNEAQGIGAALDSLQPLRSQGHEIIVVDGGSEDDSVARAQSRVDRVIHSERGRALQMNSGARVAGGDILLFLHADTRLPDEAAALIVDGLSRYAKGWGRFDVRLSARRPLLRLVATLMNWRSRLTGIATGDQAIFVRRPLFHAIGGFPAIALMEDIALSRALKRYHRPLCITARVISSSRRWEQQGLWRTILLMWRLRLAFFLGADPERLAHRYRPSSH